METGLSVRLLFVLFSVALHAPSIADSAESDVAINEINYNADPGNPGGEFLEITNHGSTPVDIGNWVVDQAVSFVFPSGTTIDSGEFIVLANNLDTASAFYGVPIFGEYLGRLANGGDTILLKNAALSIVDLVKYDDDAPWPTEADGGGPSLELIDPELDNNDFNNWGLGQPFSPGAENAPTSGGEVGDIAISEIMYKPRRQEDRVKFDRVNLGPYTEEGDDLLGEYVEVVNVSTVTIDLTGWAFTDGIDYTFGNVSIAPGQTLLIAAFQDEMEDRTEQPALGPYAGTLANGGERVTLLDAAGTLVDTVRYNDKPPWPVSPDQFGFSLEVIDPAEDNSSSANWRASIASYSGGGGSPGNQIFVEVGDTWRYRKGTSEYPAGWTEVGFGDSGWLLGRTGIGYGDGDDETVLSDMRDNYVSFAARKTFHVSQAQYDDIGQLILEVNFDDAFVAYLNGQEIARSSLLVGAGSPVPYSTAIPDPGREAGVFDSFTISRSRVNRGSGSAGDNVLAIQLHNRTDSSDASMMARMTSHRSSSGSGDVGDLVGGGTPGFVNSVDATGLPPFVASLEHLPVMPRSSQSVQITAFIESESPLTNVQILFATNTSTSFATVSMFDDGAHGDGAADDGFWGGEIPPQSSPTFVNYRVRATDSQGRTTIYPYDDEPSETQGYLSFNDNISTTLPIYHLYIRSVDESTLASDPYDDRYVNAHLAIDGVAYPNIDVRLRGRQSRKSSKRQWKFRFNRHQLHEGNRTLDTMLNQPFTQWLSFALFERGNIPNLAHDMIRVYKNGSFFGVYVMFESPNSSWVRKEGLPAATEVYKARSVETPNESKNSDLFTNQLVTDRDFWGAWNKKLRALEKPTHIRELTFNLNNMSDSELLPWLDQNVNLEQWFERWILHLLMSIRDFAGHNYYAVRPAGDKWTWVGYDYCSFGGETTRAFYGDGVGGVQGWERNKLCQRVSRNRTLRRIWNLKLRQILDTYWDLGEIFAFIDSNYSRVSSDRSLDLGRWGNFWRSGTGGTKSGLSAYRSSLRSWVNGQSLPPVSATPTMFPPGGAQSGPVNVSISVPSGYSAYYTVDGSDPRLSPTRQPYTGSIPIEDTTTLLAAALDGSLTNADWTDLAVGTFELPTNVPPVIEDQDLATDDPIAITLSLDDPDGPGPYVYTINGPDGGSLSGTPPNVTYTPDPGTGFDSFTWSVNDGLFDSQIATVTIDIISVNAIPVGIDQITATTESSPVGVTLDFDDPDGPGPFTYSINQPASGQVTGTPPSVTFTPGAGFSGEAFFSWTVNDGIDDSGLAAVTISVADNQPPVAQGRNLATAEDSAIGVTLSFTDADGPGPYVYTVNDPQNGSLSGTAPGLTYTPSLGFTGQDSFTYSVSDGIDDSPLATVSISVAENAPPLAQSKSAATTENDPVAIRLAYTDPDGPGPYQYNVNSPGDGIVSGTPPAVTYTPNSGFVGEDFFIYTVSDGLDESLTATVTITVTETNDPPVPQSMSVSTEQGEPVSIVLRFVDPDGPGPYTYTRVGPSNGTISGTAPNLTYRPNVGFFGQDSFTYRVNDGIDPSISSATVSITVDRSVGPVCYCDDDVGAAFSASNLGVGAGNYSDAIGVGAFDRSCGSEDCAATGTHEVRGTAGQRIENHLYVNIISQIPSNDEQISGWSFAIKFDDRGTSSVLTGATTTGTAGCDVGDCPGAGLVDGGFDQTEIISPSRNGGQEGAVSAVVMTFDQEIITLPRGQTAVLDLTFEVTVPQTATSSPAATFSLVDGLRGAGFPVNNAVTVGNTSVPYGNVQEVSADIIATPRSGGSDRFIRADYNGNNFVEPLTDPVFLLRWLFRDGLAPPCLAACDFNADGNVQINDPIALLNWGFRGAADPREPFPNCGPGNGDTDADLGCETPTAVCQ